MKRVKTDESATKVIDLSSDKNYWYKYNISSICVVPQS